MVFHLLTKICQKGPILPIFPIFPNKRRWKRDCNIPSWAQHCFKKSFLALKNRTFQVKSKTTKIINKAGHYNSFFLLLFQHFKTQLRRVNETTTNQQDVVLKISQREIDYHTFNCWCSLNVGFLLCNLFEEKNSKREIDSPNFIVAVIFKRCWYLSILTKELAAIFWSSYNWRESKSYYQKG